MEKYWLQTCSWKSLWSLLLDLQKTFSVLGTCGQFLHFPHRPLPLIKTNCRSEGRYVLQADVSVRFLGEGKLEKLAWLAVSAASHVGALTEEALSLAFTTDWWGSCWRVRVHLGCPNLNWVLWWILSSEWSQYYHVVQNNCPIFLWAQSTHRKIAHHCFRPLSFWDDILYS